MVFRLAGLVGKGLASRAAKLEAASSFPLIEINLKKEIDYYRNIDFKEEKHASFIFQQWIHETIYPDINDFSVLNTLRWYDLGLFHLAVLPLTSVLYKHCYYLRILTIGKDMSQPLSLNVYKKDEYEEFWPGILNQQNELFLNIVPRRFGILDYKISGNPFMTKYFTLMFGIEESKVLAFRVKIIPEGKGKLAKTYDEIKNKRFYDIVDLPYVTPRGSQSLVYNIQIGNYNPPRKKKIALLNLDKFLEGTSNHQWISDFTSLSDYWES